MPGEAPITLRPRFPCSGDDLAAARACEALVFGRSFGNTAAELDAELGPYEATTSLGAVFRSDGSAVGTVRLVRNGGPGLKTLRDSAAAPWSLAVPAACAAAGIDVTTTWDVATFAVDAAASAARHPVATALLSVMFGAFRDNDVATFVAILDVGARRPLAALGVQVLDLPGAHPAAYLGSVASIPVYRHLHDLHDLHRSRFGGIHQQVFHGRDVVGLDPDLGRAGAYRLNAA